MRAIQIDEFGGPEVLQLRDVAEPDVPEGCTAIDVAAAGINYADTHQAENSYLASYTLPLIPGTEVVGTTGDGRRVVALLAGSGGYAERAVAADDLTFDVPAGISDAEALSAVLQGATAWHLLRTSAHLAKGESVVVHAAAGGVGSIAVQLAKRWGAGRVIASASSEDKRRLASELGADVTIDSSASDLKAAIEQANDGRKVDVVLDMAGGATFDAGLAAIAPFGRMVTYGGASREPATPVAPGKLMQRSRAVIGFWLVHCLTVPGMLRGAVEELLQLTAAGELRAIDGGSYPLAEARQAHEDLRARRTVGKLTLIP